MSELTFLRQEKVRPTAVGRIDAINAYKPFILSWRSSLLAAFKQLLAKFRRVLIPVNMRAMLNNGLNEFFL